MLSTCGCINVLLSVKHCCNIQMLTTWLLNTKSLNYGFNEVYMLHLDPML